MEGMEYVFGSMIFAALAGLAFFGLWLTVLKRYADPKKPDQKISYLQLLLLGLGGIGSIVSLLAAFLTLTSAQRIETRRAEAAQRIETQRAEAELVQQYLQGMETLTMDNKLPEFGSDTDDSEKDRIRRAARAQTLAVLRSVEDVDRKRVVMRFLDEAELIKKAEPVVDLSDANIAGASLGYVGLGDTDLSRALLSNASLFHASLSGTNLYGAHLDGADLRGANLTEANLGWAGLAEADLRGADLTGADLSDAVGITNEELEQQAKSLEGATMPDGSKHD